MSSKDEILLRCASSSLSLPLALAGRAAAARPLATLFRLLLRDIPLGATTTAAAAGEATVAGTPDGPLLELAGRTLGAVVGETGEVPWPAASTDDPLLPGDGTALRTGRGECGEPASGLPTMLPPSAEDDGDPFWWPLGVTDFIPRSRRRRAGSGRISTEETDAVHPIDEDTR
jgi:hypothetical protein